MTNGEKWINKYLCQKHSELFTQNGFFARFMEKVNEIRVKNNEMCKLFWFILNCAKINHQENLIWFVKDYLRFFV